MQPESHEFNDSNAIGLSVPADPPSRLQRGGLHLRRLDLVAWVLLLGLSLALLSVTGVVIYLMDRQGDKAVVGEQAVGQVVAVTPTAGLFAGALVETTVGFYAVTGELGLSKAQELVLQTRANHRRYLCDASPRCMPLR